MKTQQVLRGFSVLAIVLAAFVMWTPTTVSEASDMRASSCLETLRQQLQTVLPNGWSEAQACDTDQAMGIGAQAIIVPTTGNEASGFCREALHQELGTVLPSGLANAQACSTLQSVQAARQNGIIPVTGGQADPTDPVACWHDAGASSCR